MKKLIYSALILLPVLAQAQTENFVVRGTVGAPAYGVQSVPQNFLLDPRGKIVAVNPRGEELQTTLAKLLSATN